MILLEDGQPVGEVIGVPDRSEQLRAAREALATIPKGERYKRQRASWERAIAALSTPDARTLVDGDWIDGGDVRSMQAAKIKAECKSEIFAVYSEHRQWNITRAAQISGDATELLEMDEWINAKREACRARIAALYGVS